MEYMSLFFSVPKTNEGLFTSKRFKKQFFGPWISLRLVRCAGFRHSRHHGTTASHGKLVPGQSGWIDSRYWCASVLGRHRAPFFFCYFFHRSMHQSVHFTPPPSSSRMFDVLSLFCSKHGDTAPFLTRPIMHFELRQTLYINQHSSNLLNKLLSWSGGYKAQLYVGRGAVECAGMLEPVLAF